MFGEGRGGLRVMAGLDLISVASDDLMTDGGIL